MTIDFIVSDLDGIDMNNVWLRQDVQLATILMPKSIYCIEHLMAV